MFYEKGFSKFLDYSKKNIQHGERFQDRCTCDVPEIIKVFKKKRPERLLLKLRNGTGTSLGKLSFISLMIATEVPGLPEINCLSPGKLNVNQGVSRQNLLSSLVSLNCPRRILHMSYVLADKAYAV